MTIYALFLCVVGSLTCSPVDRLPARLAAAGMPQPGYATAAECLERAAAMEAFMGNTRLMRYRCFKREPEWQPVR